MLDKFTPFYFKRLDSYQEIRRQQKRGRASWDLEKQILIYGAIEHERLAYYWMFDDMVKFLAGKNHIPVDSDFEARVFVAVSNLEKRKLVEVKYHATRTEHPGVDISGFSDNAVVMGDVLRHSISGWWGRVKLWLGLKFFSLLLIVLLFTVFAALANQMADFFIKVHLLC